MSTEQNTIATMVRAFAEIIERQVLRFENQGAEYERKLAEHRASFGARTEADRLIIEGLRAIVKEQSDHAKDAGTMLGWAPNESAFQAAQRVVKERDGLLAQVQDQRAEIERLRADIAEELNESPPAPPEASHDTTAGKEAAASVIRNSQMTEIKVGDVVEVVSASGGQTWMADVGSTGKVRRFELIDSIECVRLQNLPGKRNALGGYVSLCDVRKVPQ